MKEYDDIFQRYGLRNLGSFYPEKGEQYLLGVRTMVLLGPDEPRFWNIFSTSREFRDGFRDPLDRWSLRIVRKLARQCSAKAFFPFGKKEKHPFFSWALKSGEAFVSPAHLLVHNELGLFVSYRGALGFNKKIIFEKKEITSPCIGCSRPCLRSCPVNAIDSQKYNYSLCSRFLRESEGIECLSGCLARRACPIGRKKRLAEQSNFHMKELLRNLDQ